jgi:coenzyme PQQ biosynthesis protein C
VKPLTPQELEAQLRAIGARRYHRLHPFHALLHGGKCSKGQVQAWALNRYYYQAMIPVKDASLIARCGDPALRREWRRRLVDHDGESEGDGGIARWLKLTDGVGLDRDYVVSLAGLLPATRFAVEAYVHFVRDKTLLEAVASSLTELFSPQIISERLEGMLKGYDFVSADTLAYFAKRPPLAQRDSDFALNYVMRHAKTPDVQQAVLKACYGPCSTRSIMPTWRRSIFRPAPSCLRTGGAAERSQHRHRLRRAPAAAARRSARPQRGTGRLGAACARAGLQG